MPLRLSYSRDSFSELLHSYNGANFPLQCRVDIQEMRECENCKTMEPDLLTWRLQLLFAISSVDTIFGQYASAVGVVVKTLSKPERSMAMCVIVRRNKH